MRFFSCRSVVIVLYIPIIGLCSCSQKKAITLSDLKFPEPRRLSFQRNQIDTVFIYDLLDDGREQLSSYETYDENGRITSECEMPHSAISTTIRFYYDNFGLLIRKETIKEHDTWIDSLSYEFDQDSLLLRQKWTTRRLEFRFYFDNNGRLVQSIKIDKTFEKAGVSKEKLLYDGDLLSKSLFYFDNKDTSIYETNWYYKPNGLLDSSSIKTSYGYRQAWKYDSQGLVSDEWGSNKDMPFRKYERRYVYNRRNELR